MNHEQRIKTPVEKDAKLKKGEVDTTTKGFGPQALTKQKRRLHLQEKKETLMRLRV